jgi:Ca2+-transporting ATPase
VLWVNLLTHGPVGVAMGAEPAAADVFSRPPRRPSEQVFDRPLVWQVVGLATAIAVVCLGVAAWSRSVGGPWQTQLFVTLTAAQLVLALALRPPGAWCRGFSDGGLWLPVAAVANVLLLLAGVYLPGLTDLLRTDPLSAAEFGIAFAAALVPSGLYLVVRRLHRR